MRLHFVQSYSKRRLTEVPFASLVGESSEPKDFRFQEVMALAQTKVQTKAPKRERRVERSEYEGMKTNEM